MSGFQGNDNLRDKRNLNTKNGKVRSKGYFIFVLKSSIEPDKVSMII